MMKSLLVRLAMATCLVVFVLPDTTDAQCGGCGTTVGCASCVQASPCGGCGGCGVQYVERTVMVPTWETQSRMVTVTEYQMQQQERTRMVYNRVPTQVERTRTYNVCVPVTQTRTVQYTECVPVVREVERTWTECVAVPREVEQTYTRMVPAVETRTGTRMVCETYQEQVVRHVTRDMGCWQTQMVEVPCGPSAGCGVPSCGDCRGRLFPIFRRSCGGCNTGCGGCATSYGGCATACGGCAPATRTVCQRVWVPNIVTEEIPCTVTRSRMVPQEYSYDVTVCRPVQETRMVTVTDYERVQRSEMVEVTTYENHTRTKEVEYTSYELQPKTETYMCTEYHTEATEVTETVNVCVPVQVQKEVHVQVCTMVPQVQTVAVGCNSCPTQSSCCRGGFLRRILSRGCGSSCASACGGCY